MCYITGCEAAVKIMFIFEEHKKSNNLQNKAGIYFSIYLLYFKTVHRHAKEGVQ